MRIPGGRARVRVLCRRRTLGHPPRHVPELIVTLLEVFT